MVIASPRASSLSAWVISVMRVVERKSAATVPIMPMTQLAIRAMMSGFLFLGIFSDIYSSSMAFDIFKGVTHLF